MTLTLPRPTEPAPRAVLCAKCDVAGLHYHCDLCDRASGRGVNVLRFSLVHSTLMADGRRRTSRGVGTMLLCTRCWATTAGRRRRRIGGLAPEP